MARQLTYYEATSRKATRYKGSRGQFSNIIELHRNPVRTPETINEFLSKTKDQQTEIKDVGGLFFGELKSGIRKASYVLSRSGLSIDLDFVKDAQVLIDRAKTWPFSWLLTSTHKHTWQKPRLRLFIPFSEPLTDVDLYEPISRMFCKQYLEMDWLDPTTHELNRMMFKPSVSADGEYIFEYQDVPECMDYNEMLAFYNDPMDLAEWPLSPEEVATRKSDVKKLGDSRNRAGEAGKFNAAYFPIQKALELLLPEFYTPTDSPNRFTYTAGSSAGGLLIYDDMWAYSHHSTDPAHDGHDKSAYDLVLLHKFKGKKKAMRDFLLADPIYQEYLASEPPMFQVLDDEPVIKDGKLKVPPQLINGLEGGLINKRIAIEWALEHDPELKGFPRMNQFSEKLCTSKPLPWNRSNEEREWSDADEASLRSYMESRWNISSKEKIADALLKVATQHGYHPIREWFDSLPEWDGEDRISYFFIDFLNAENCNYTKTVTRKMFTALVKRVMEPGCKFDNVLVLIGPQGIGKSYILRALVGDKYFTDSFYTFNGKEAYEAIHGFLIVEISEMSAGKKADNEQIKMVLSAQSDSYRPAYGKYLRNFPRQNIFVGTSNEMEFLRDTTGNRRFWPVVCDHGAGKSPFKDMTKEYREQLFAQALDLYRKGEPLYLSKEEEAEAVELRKRHKSESLSEILIRSFIEQDVCDEYYKADPEVRASFKTDNPTNPRPRAFTCGREIIDIAFGGRNYPSMQQITSIMASLGWVKEPRREWHDPKYGRQRYYVPAESLEDVNDSFDDTDLPF